MVCIKDIAYDKPSLHLPNCYAVYYKHNVIRKDLQRKNVVNNVDMSSLMAPWHNGPYKNTQNNTKTRRTPRRNRHSEKNYEYLFVFFFINQIVCLKIIFLKANGYCLLHFITNVQWHVWVCISANVAMVKRSVP